MMALPRMTTRRWMFAVAVVALGLGFARLIQLRAHYQSLALIHRRNEAALVRQAREFDMQAHWATWDAVAQYPLTVPNRPWHELASTSRVEARDLHRMAAHEARLGAQYERLARRPWLPVPPDPPEPD